MKKYIIILICLLTMTGCSSTSENTTYQNKELPVMQKELIGNHIPDWVMESEQASSLFVLGGSDMEEFDAYAIDAFPTYYDAEWTQEQSDAVCLGKGIYCFSLGNQTVENICVYYPVILRGTIVSTLLVYKNVDTGEFGSQMGPNTVNELNMLAELTTIDSPAIIGFNHGNLIAIVGTDYYILDNEKMYGSKVEVSEIPQINTSDHDVIDIMEILSRERNANDAKAAENEPSTAPKPEIGTTQATGALYVKGTQLADSNGNAVQLKGISTHGLAWFPDYVNEECFRQLHQEWGVNVIRLAMYTAEYGGYCSGGSQSELKALIKRGVEIATAEDMYVIIDWHILSDNNPNTYIEEAKTFFAEMSAEYADYHNVLYEICNEPNGGTGWSDIKAYAKEVAGVIRSNDKDGIILVGTPNWSQYVDQAAADPITEYDNIMYTLHFYAATHTDSLRQTMTEAIDSGLPIFVSEYGICDASGNGAIDENQADQWVNVMNDHGVSYIAWNLSNKNETSAILDSGCTKTSGFTWNDLSASGKWLYRMLTGNADDTE